MRNRFDRQLTDLNKNLIEMGSCCENCIGLVAMALAKIQKQSNADGGNAGAEAENPDSAAAENAPGSVSEGALERVLSSVYETDSEIDKLESEIENLCLRLLLEQQPVARDLRYISAALKMISDMERIGDQCSDIADIASFLQKGDEGRMQSTTHIQEMATATMSMVTEAVDSFIKRDLDLAHKVMDSDDIVDALFSRVKHEIVDLIAKYPDHGESLLDFLMIAKYFERIGDHATNIAEWVVFSITGQH